MNYVNIDGNLNSLVWLHILTINEFDIESLPVANLNESPSRVRLFATTFERQICLTKEMISIIASKYK